MILKNHIKTLMISIYLYLSQLIQKISYSLHSCVHKLATELTCNNRTIKNIAIGWTTWRSSPHKASYIEKMLNISSTYFFYFIFFIITLLSPVTAVVFLGIMSLLMLIFGITAHLYQQHTDSSLLIHGSFGMLFITSIMLLFVSLEPIVSICIASVVFSWYLQCVISHYNPRLNLQPSNPKKSIKKQHQKNLKQA
ncbi:MAG: hypothetical protein ACON5A_00825 [Candidatus Comchoanobacterales bacterium]